MPFLLRKYAHMKKWFYRSPSVHFTNFLRSYKTVLIHPIMEPGREAFSLQAVESIVGCKGKTNVELLVNRKSEFFFKNIPSRKIVYEDFVSPLSSPYKDLRKALAGKKYDIYLEMNRFSDEMLTMFGVIAQSKIHMCLDGSKENPIYNLVITVDESYAEVDRNNAVLKALGVKKIKKKIGWKKGILQKKTYKKIGISIENSTFALSLFSILKKGNHDPILFVTGAKRLEKMRKKIGNGVVPLYPLDNAYNVCLSCASLITSINPLLSFGFLQQKKTLLVLDQKKTFCPQEDHSIEILAPEKELKLIIKKIKDFVERK